MYVPVGNQQEYDDAVSAYFEIKRDYPRHDWTIISPVEQYNQSLGYGWHYELWEFVRLMSDNKSLVIPTSYVFLFVEKKPFLSKQLLDVKDAQKPFTAIYENPTMYYTEVDSRRILEAKAYVWAEKYMKSHDNMKIFIENDLMKIYVIEQDTKKKVDLLK